MDLIRIAHRDSTRAVVRGYFETRDAARPTWYSCDARRGGAGWQVERVVLDP
jgi:hypothetical protein